MNYRNESEEQLIKLFKDKKANNKELNKEWRRRYHINFPYKVNKSGVIVDCLRNAFVGDRQMDEIVLVQAKRIREQIKVDRSYAG